MLRLIGSKSGRPTSLNTGFSNIFDFGGTFKDGSLPFINVDINKCEPNGPYILGTLFNVHLWFWWYRPLAFYHLVTS